MQATRVIAGYNCDEFSFTDQIGKTTGKVWLAKDATLRIDNRAWQRTAMGVYYGYKGFEGGVLLASEAFDGKGNMVTSSETKEINLKFSHSISLKGLKLTQMEIGIPEPYHQKK